MRTRCAVALLALTVVGCLPPSEHDLQVAETIVQMSDAMAEVQQYLGELQEQIDSLRLVVVRQDTIIRQLANLAGVPVR